LSLDTLTGQPVELIISTPLTARNNLSKKYGLMDIEYEFIQGAVVIRFFIHPSARIPDLHSASYPFTWPN